MTEAVFTNVGHVEYTNAQILYTTLGGVRYQIGGTYSGAYPGATRDTQTLETDSVTINVSSTASAQQWSFQAPAAKHPAFDDMFAAQTDGNPRNIQLKVPKRTLFSRASPNASELGLVVADGPANFSNGTFSGSLFTGAGKQVEPAQYPVNAHVKLGVSQNPTHPIVGIRKESDVDQPVFPRITAISSAAAVQEIFMAGLQFGNFLANIDEVGQVDDTGVVVYRVAFTPVSVVEPPELVV